MIITLLGRMSRGTAASLAGILGAVAYARTLGFGFVWDDTYFVVRNAAVQSWTAIGSWFASAAAYAAPGINAPMFRPVRNFSYLLDHSLAGLNPTAFHLTNVLLHGLNCMALCLLLVALLEFALKDKPADGGDPHLGNGVEDPAPEQNPVHAIVPAALLATLWWAWHPVQTESVVWIKSRDELLFTLFLLAGGLALFLVPRRPLLGWVLFGGGVSLSLLSKEMAASLPLLLLVAGFAFRRTPASPILNRATVVAGVLVVLFVVWRHLVLGKTEQGGRISGSILLDGMTTLAVVWEYARVMIYPVYQSADHQGYPVVTSLIHPRALPGLLVLMAVVGGGLALLLRPGRHHRALGLSLLFVPVALLPVSNAIPAMQYLAERFLYFPSMGLAAVVAVILARNFRPVIMGGSAAVLLLFLLLNLERQSIWRNQTTLYIANYRDGWKTGTNRQRYASALMQLGRIEEAGVIMRSLLPDGKPPRPYDSSPGWAHQGYASTQMALGKYDSSLTHTLEALRLLPTMPEALMNLGVIRGNAQDHRAALEAFTSATLYAPGDRRARAYRDQALRFVQSQTTGSATLRP
jgi:hypothetical protein